MSLIFARRCCDIGFHWAGRQRCAVISVCVASCARPASAFGAARRVGKLMCFVFMCVVIANHCACATACQNANNADRETCIKNMVEFVQFCLMLVWRNVHMFETCAKCVCFTQFSDRVPRTRFTFVFRNHGIRL